MKLNCVKLVKKGFCDMLCNNLLEHVFEYSAHNTDLKRHYPLVGFIVGLIMRFFVGLHVGFITGLIVGFIMLIVGFIVSLS